MAVTLGDDELLSIEEAAGLLHVHKSMIRRWIDRGDVPAYRVGRRRLALKRTDLARMIAPARAADAHHKSAVATEHPEIRPLTP